MMSTKIKFVIALSITILIAISVRIFVVVFETPEPSYLSKIWVQPPRPHIFSGDGVLLRGDLIRYMVYVDPSVLSDKAFKSLAQEIPSKMKLSNFIKYRAVGKRYVYYATTIDIQKIKKVSSMYGVIVNNKKYRYAPNIENNDLIGRVGYDGVPLSGIELYAGSPPKKRYGMTLRSRVGGAMYGKEILSNNFYHHDIINTTIDLGIQRKLEGYLVEAYEEFKPAAAFGAVVDLNTGGIIAYHKITNNKSAYYWNFMKQKGEPGSILKPIIYAAALSYGSVTPTTVFDGGGGSIRVGGRTIHDVHGHKDITANDIVVMSSNVGIVQVARTIPNKYLYKFISDMGLFHSKRYKFGSVRGSRVPNLDSEIVKATFSFGHSAMVSPAHIMEAYGKLLTNNYNFKLKVVADDSTLRKSPIMSEDNFISFNNALREVVLRGTARRIKGSSLPIVGKTGTSEKVIGGRYNKMKVVGSFVGAFEKGGHHYMAYVALDEPKKAHYGGTVAAPVVRKILEDLENGTTVKKHIF